MGIEPTYKVSARYTGLEVEKHNPEKLSQNQDIQPFH